MGFYLNKVYFKEMKLTVLFLACLVGTAFTAPADISKRRWQGQSQSQSQGQFGGFGGQFQSQSQVQHGKGGKQGQSQSQGQMNGFGGQFQSQTKYNTVKVVNKVRVNPKDK